MLLASDTTKFLDIRVLRVCKCQVEIDLYRMCIDTYTYIVHIIMWLGQQMDQVGTNQVVIIKSWVLYNIFMLCQL